jgi:diguanylate cyclase (GGDEF)-like protein/PAS domain S-box-containing protein
VEPYELAGVLDAIGDGIYVVDPQRRIVFWNDGAEQISGYTRAEVVGRSCGDGLLEHVDESGDGLCGTRCPLQATLIDGLRRECRVFMHHKDGSMVPVRVAASPVYSGDRTITGAVEVFVDDTARVRALRQVERLSAMALLDSLTGLGNRAFLERTLEAKGREARASGEPFGVLFIDVDHFKRVNDTYGHAIGDEVLRVLARTLARNQRVGDEIARFGGEEFVLVTGPIAPQGLVTLAERLRVLVRTSRVNTSTEPVSVQVSIGAAMARPDDSPQQVLDRADQRLLAAKRNGRDRVVASDVACDGDAPGSAA